MATTMPTTLMSKRSPPLKALLQKIIGLRRDPQPKLSLRLFLRVHGLVQINPHHP